MPLEIKGLQKTSLVDFPGKVCATIFLGGCNFRCPFCYNIDLVLHPERVATIPRSEVLAFLESRRKWLDGVCITGGEPTVHAELPALVGEIKKLGLLVKVDTNGSNPGMLREMADKKLLDYVAMDIKSGRENYARAAGVDADMGAIQKSIDLLMQNKAQYEFRTTAVPGFFGEKIAEEIGKWLRGAERYALQQFKSDVKLLDEKLQGVKPFPREKMEQFAETLKKYIKTVELRI